MVKNNFLILVILVFQFFLHQETRSQVLAGTDELERTLPLNISVGNLQKSKNVAIFYFIWHDDGLIAGDVRDLREIVPNHPEVLEDYDNQYCGKLVFYEGRPCPAYYWGKPIYGYYRADNYWVALKSL